MAKRGVFTYEINGTFISVLPNVYIGKIHWPARDHPEDVVGVFRVFLDADKVYALEAAIEAQKLVAAGTFTPGADLVAKIAASEEAQKALDAATASREAAYARTLPLGIAVSEDHQKPPKEWDAALAKEYDEAVQAEVEPDAAYAAAVHAQARAAEAAIAAVEPDRRRAIEEASKAVEAASKAVTVLTHIEVRTPWVDGQDPYAAVYAKLSELPAVSEMEDV